MNGVRGAVAGLRSLMQCVRQPCVYMAARAAVMHFSRHDCNKEVWRPSRPLHQLAQLCCPSRRGSVFGQKQMLSYCLTCI